MDEEDPKISWPGRRIGEAETAGDVVGATEHETRAAASREADAAVLKDGDLGAGPQSGTVPGPRQRAFPKAALMITGDGVTAEGG
jgi:hypothetical protein